MTLRVVELFAGIGAQAQALEDLGIDFESTVCEIDEKAYKSYCAIHGDTPNLGDITKVEHLPECDLLTYSFPCQDLSIRGGWRWDPARVPACYGKSAGCWMMQRAGDAFRTSC